MEVDFHIHTPSRPKDLLPAQPLPHAAVAAAAPRPLFLRRRHYRSACWLRLGILIGSLSSLLSHPIKIYVWLLTDNKKKFSQLLVELEVDQSSCQASGRVIPVAVEVESDGGTGGCGRATVAVAEADGDGGGGGLMWRSNGSGSRSGYE